MRTLLLVLLVLLVGVLGSAPAAAADDRSATRPSVLFPVAGGLMIGAGAFLNYHYTAHAKNEDPRCSGVDRRCFWLSTLGLGIEQIGGVLGAWWFWRMGEAAWAADVAAGRPAENRRTMAVTGLVLAGVGLAVTYGATVYYLGRGLCISPSMPEGIDFSCQADGHYMAAMLNLISLPFFLAGVPLAGYGLGYQTAAKRSASDSGGALSRDIRVFPFTMANGGGVSLTAAF